MNRCSTSVNRGSKNGSYTLGVLLGNRWHGTNPATYTWVVELWSAFAIVAMVTSIAPGKNRGNSLLGSLYTNVLNVVKYTINYFASARIPVVCVSLYKGYNAEAI